VEKTNRAVQNLFSESSCALCVSQGVIRPFSNDFQFFRGKSPRCNGYRPFAFSFVLAHPGVWVGVCTVIIASFELTILGLSQPSSPEPPPPRRLTSDPPRDDPAQRLTCFSEWWSSRPHCPSSSTLTLKAAISHRPSSLGPSGPHAGSQRRRRMPPVVAATRALHVP
jgi:hypothetical protein